MPLKKARKKSKKSVAKAVAFNMHELKHAKKKRPLKQRIAIALKAAGVARKKKKKK